MKINKALTIDASRLKILINHLFDKNVEYIVYMHFYLEPCINAGIYGTTNYNISFIKV